MQMSTCLGYIDITEFLDRVISGLKDLDDVKVLCYMSLHRLQQVAPTAVLSRLEDVAEGVTETMKDITVVKKDTMAQDVQRNVRGSHAATLMSVGMALTDLAVSHHIGGDATLGHSGDRPAIPSHK
jgi:hypothetical protein